MKSGPRPAHTVVDLCHRRPLVFTAWAAGQPDYNAWTGQNEMAPCYRSVKGSPAPAWNGRTGSPPHEGNGRIYGRVVEHGEAGGPAHQRTWGEITSVFR